MDKAKIIFIGAGTANLTAARVLLERGMDNFLILEKGGPLGKRYCPGEKSYTCTFCKKGCFTIEGLGGSNALHGNKMCYFPASNSIQRQLGNSNSSDSFLNLLLAPYLDTKNNEGDSATENSKFYNSDVLSQTHFHELVNLLAKPLIDKILFNKHIIDISKEDHSFTLTSTAGNSFICENVILGSGRASYKEIKTIFQKLKVNFFNPAQDIGIRIETDKKFFSDKYYYQIDPKFKYEFAELGSARTFCAHNQGKVVPVQYGRSFYADGAFGGEFSDENNIALMVRSKEYLDDDQLEDWCSMVNNSAGNQLVLADLKFDNASKGEVINTVLDNLPAFPSDVHNKLIKLLLNKLIFEDDKLFNDEFYNDGYLKIYGPAIDLYWPSPNLNDSLESIDVSNFYVIGDATGISRGFFQGIYSGAEWAIKFLSRIESKEFVNDKIRSSRIPSSIR